MKETLVSLLKNRIQKLKEEKDIYVLSLYVYDLDGDPRNKTVVLGYNTYKNFKKQIKEAFDEAEAKWNYTYYLQVEACVIGDKVEEREIITNWIKSQNLYFSDQKLRESHEKAMVLGDEITKQFDKVLVDIVKTLHQEKIIKETFKKDIPVIIHHMEYNEVVKKLNQLANPSEVIKEFVLWIDSL